MKRVNVDHLVDEIVKELTTIETMKTTTKDNRIPIGVSARHCHLNEQDLVTLFGEQATLTKKKDLLQPGQFAANETVLIAGPRGCIQNVRVLGPLRSKTQVEISSTDAIKLGLAPPIRESGKLSGSSPVTIIGPKGSVYLQQGLIIAQAHIHMPPQDAQRFSVRDGDFVRVKVLDEKRPLSFEKVKIRVSSSYVLEMHIDTDEANACNLAAGAVGELFKLGDDE